jgi:hypothetical protein
MALIFLFSNLGIEAHEFQRRVVAQHLLPGQSIHEIVQPRAVLELHNDLPDLFVPPGLKSLNKTDAAKLVGLGDPE